MIRRQTIDVSKIKRLVPFHVAEAKGVELTDIIHFFVDDRRLEFLRRRKHIHPKYYLAGAVATPDFSLYIDDSYDVWRNNTLENRRIGEWWQKEGLLVLPSVSWATEDSFEFCFDGIERGCIVVISTQSVVNWSIFDEGFEEMKKRLEPSAIICYGMGVCLEADCDVYYFPTYIRSVMNGR